jgi:hypothetical protein
MVRTLSGHTAIVALDAAGGEALARRLLREGAGVVLVSADAGSGGRVAADLDPGEAALAVFCPEHDLEQELDALVELVAELSRGRRR